MKMKKNDKKRSNQVDIEESVTNLIISKIEQGVLPWQCPWTKSGDSGFPFNWQTKENYSGINVLILWCCAVDKGYSSSAWLTFKQAKALGGNVIKGEKATTCVFAKPLIVKDEDANGQEVERKIWVRKKFSVFNLEQIEGLELPDNQNEGKCVEVGSEVDVIHAYMDAYCDSTGVKVIRGGNRAYYSPVTDHIKLPNSFRDVGGYVATLAHELGHSTGHKSRLDRFDKFGNENELDAKQEYAAEELVAELFAAFVCATVGVHGEVGQHASYIDSWLKCLRNDKKFIFRAATAASKAYRYFMDAGAEVDLDIKTVKVA